MSRHFARLMLVVFVVAAPSVTSAQSGQSAIAGVVRDSTGAVLPGVTVEASSPALIEKSRSAVTDEAGQYRVVDLRPGTYRVTFTLQGQEFTITALDDTGDGIGANVYPLARVENGVRKPKWQMHFKLGQLF